MLVNSIFAFIKESFYQLYSLFGLVLLFPDLYSVFFKNKNESRGRLDRFLIRCRNYRKIRYGLLGLLLFFSMALAYHELYAKINPHIEVKLASDITSGIGLEQKRLDKLLQNQEKGTKINYVTIQVINRSEDVLDNVRVQLAQAGILKNIPIDLPRIQAIPGKKKFDFRLNPGERASFILIESCRGSACTDGKSVLRVLQFGSEIDRFISLGEGISRIKILVSADKSRLCEKIFDLHVSKYGDLEQIEDKGPCKLRD